MKTKKQPNTLDVVKKAAQKKKELFDELLRDEKNVRLVEKLIELDLEIYNAIGMKY